MRPEEIKARLILKKISITSIAKELGVSVPMVSQVISKKEVSKRVREAIAQKIELKVNQVFGA